MGMLTGISKMLGLGKSVEDVGEYMDADDLDNVDLLNEAADFYVKPIALEGEAVAKLVEDELKQRNIVLLNIEPMKKQKKKLAEIVGDLKIFVKKINGDIAGIDEDKILLTPAKVKIVKKLKRREG